MARLFLIFLSALIIGCTSPQPSSNSAQLAISGPIVDAKTGRAIVADVYVDGKLTLSKTDHLELVIPLLSDRQTEIRVRAPGYVDWAIAVRGGPNQQMQGPVRMNRKSP